MDLALTTERPALPEVALVVAACAAVFAVLVHFDGAAARREAERARSELARRAHAAVATPVEHRRAGADIGDAGPISVPVGSAWSPGTAPAVAHAQPANGPSGPPTAVLAVMAAVGALMAATGSVMLYRNGR